MGVASHRLIASVGGYFLFCYLNDCKLSGPLMFFLCVLRVRQVSSTVFFWQLQHYDFKRLNPSLFRFFSLFILIYMSTHTNIYTRTHMWACACNVCVCVCVCVYLYNICIHTFLFVFESVVRWTTWVTCSASHVVQMNDPLRTMSCQYCSLTHLATIWRDGGDGDSKSWS